MAFVKIVFDQALVKPIEFIPRLIIVSNCFFFFEFRFFFYHDVPAVAINIGSGEKRKAPYFVLNNAEMGVFQYI